MSRFDCNIFGQTMRAWERLAPYNAAQIMSLHAGFDDELIVESWQRAMAALAIEPIAPASVELIRGDDFGAVEAHVSKELNHRFTDDEPCFRPFAVRCGEAVHVGIVYRHVAADSVSLRMVMEEWFLHLSAAEPHVSRAVRRATLDRLGRPRLGRAYPSLLRTLAQECRRFSGDKHTRRLASSPADSPVAFRRIELPRGLLDSLLQQCHEWDAKLNDLFLAAAVRACVKHLQLETIGRRRDYAIGSVTDLRRGALDARECFGLLLGFTSTRWRASDVDSIEPAVRAASRQSRESKQHDAPAASLVRMHIARLYTKRNSQAQLAEFYRKRVPLLGGISNVSLRGEWMSRVSRETLHDYTRVSPTGPSSPVVFTPTTLDDKLHVGFTWRTMQLTTSQAHACLQAFVDDLRSVASGSQSAGLVSQ